MANMARRHVNANVTLVQALALMTGVDIASAQPWKFKLWSKGPDR
jgi:hypothetical protein